MADNSLFSSPPPHLCFYLYFIPLCIYTHAFSFGIDAYLEEIISSNGLDERQGGRGDSTSGGKSGCLATGRLLVRSPGSS